MESWSPGILAAGAAPHHSGARELHGGHEPLQQRMVGSRQCGDDGRHHCGVRSESPPPTPAGVDATELRRQGTRRAARVRPPASAAPAARQRPRQRRQSRTRCPSAAARLLALHTRRGCHIRFVAAAAAVGQAAAAAAAAAARSPASPFGQRSQTCCYMLSVLRRWRALP
jgi:hypothetical protein